MQHIYKFPDSGSNAERPVYTQAKPLQVAIIGAAGQICYSLLKRIAAGDVFGCDVPLVLRLLEVPVEKVQKALSGVAMELEDCAFPLVHGIVCTDSPEVAFKGANWCLLIGAKPRGPGMERADLIKDNARIFVAHGRAIDDSAAEDCRVVVVGNPCNTNCMIAAAQARRLPKKRFTSMMRLDQNRATALLAQKAKVPVAMVERMAVFGNHSPASFPDFMNATIVGQPVPEIIDDPVWLRDIFIDTVGKRGAAIIATRGVSSALSAASAIGDHVRALNTPGAVIHSAGVMSHGEYGFAPGVWAGMPIRTVASGEYQIATDFVHDDFARQRLAKSNDELLAEREMVAEMMPFAVAG